jgi:phospholipid/cholesterol/gamma-HCH transport system ATP-binding protein
MSCWFDSSWYFFRENVMTATTTPAPIQVTSLHKSFGEQKVLRGMDLEVAPGETLAILGRSGTGKSVLLKLIVGLQQPDSGSIRVHGQEVAGLGPDRLREIRKKIGFLFQSAALYDSLTIGENIAFPLKRHTDMSEAQQRRRVRELLSSVGLDKVLDKMPADISGGMQKRVGLARALALSPDILLFDEPTAGLDPITAKEIYDLILKLQSEQKLSSIIVTHDINGARAVSDRLALLRDGNILVEGTFAQLQKSRDKFVVQFLGANS